MIIDEMNTFQDIFKKLRQEKKLSQDKIAEELEVSPALISKWENGVSTPGPMMLDYIADYFKVSVDYLIGRTTDKRYYISNNKNDIANILYSKVATLPEDKQRFILNVTETVMREIDEQLDK